MSKKIGNKISEDPNDHIRENMKCPVCMEILLPPIYQCETGHNICYACVENVHVCPLCKGDYGDTRNYFAEELVTSMTFSCKYEEYGCKHSCLGSILKDHQETCECQPYRCPELACKEVTGFGQMGKHLEKHGYEILQGNSHTTTIEINDEHFDKRTEYNPWRISAFEREFYALAVRSKDGTWFFWTWMLGLPKEAKNFSSEIVLYTSVKSIVFRGLVHSLRTSPEEVTKGSNCLIVNDQLIKSMRKSNRIVCRVRFIEGKVWEVPKPKLKKAPQVKGSVATPAKDPRKKVPTLKSNLPIGPCPGPPPNTPVACASPYVTKKPNMVLSKLKGTKKPTTTQDQRNSVVSYLRLKVSDEENNFVVKMRESLRCPGCQQVISPPILQCTIGHNICSNCRAIREDCPLCRAPIGMSRNFFAEELLYRTTQKCKFHGNGCHVCLPTAQIRLHEMTCDFAPFECPFDNCRTVIDSRQLLTHFNGHKILPVDKEMRTFINVPKTSPPNSDSICSIPNIVMMDGAAFYPLIVKDQSGLWAFWVCSSEYGKYRYEIVLRKQSKILAFQGPVLSLRIDQSQVLSNGLALITTERAVRGLKTKTDNKLDYSLKIAPIRRKASHPMVTFAVKLGNDVKKFKSNTVLPRAELHANSRTSDCLHEDDDENELDDSQQFLQPDVESEIDADDEYFEEASRKTTSTENLEVIPENVQVVNDVFSFKRIKHKYDLSEGSFDGSFSSPAISDFEKETKDAEASLAKFMTKELPSFFGLISGRNPDQVPEIIASSPILAPTYKITRHQNVRISAKNMRNFSNNFANKLPSSVTNIWTSKPYGSLENSTPQFDHSNPDVNGNPFVIDKLETKIERKEPEKSYCYSTKKLTQKNKLTPKKKTSKLASNGISITNTIASLDVAINESYQTFGVGEKNQNLQQEQDQPENFEIIAVKKVSSTRSNLRVKFADQSCNITPSESQFDLRKEISKPQKSALKVTSKNNMTFSDESGPGDESVSDEKFVGLNSLINKLNQTFPDLVTIDEYVNSFEDFDKINDQIVTFGLVGPEITAELENNGNLHIEEVAGEIPLIDFGTWDIAATRIDTAIFEGHTFKSDLQNCIEEGQRTNSSSSRIVSECDLLKQTARTMVMEDIPRNCPEDVMKSIATGGSQSHIIAFPDRNDLAKEPILEHSQIVEESQTACQVGSSLIKLNESSANMAEEHSGSSILDFSKSYDAITDGISTTFNAAKNILSGLMSTTQDDDYEGDEEESLFGNIFLASDDYGGYEDNESN